MKHKPNTSDNIIYKKKLFCFIALINYKKNVKVDFKIKIIAKLK